MCRRALDVPARNMAARPAAGRPANPFSAAAPGDVAALSCGAYAPPAHVALPPTWSPQQRRRGGSGPEGRSLWQHAKPAALAPVPLVGEAKALRPQPHPLSAAVAELLSANPAASEQAVAASAAAAAQLLQQAVEAGAGEGAGEGSGVLSARTSTSGSEAGEPAWGASPGAGPSLLLEPDEGMAAYFLEVQRAQRTGRRSASFGSPTGGRTVASQLQPLDSPSFEFVPQLLPAPEPPMVSSGFLGLVGRAGAWAPAAAQRSCWELCALQTQPKPGRQGPRVWRGPTLPALPCPAAVQLKRGHCPGW